MALQIQLEPHDRLLAQAFITRWRAPIAQLPPLAAAVELLASPIGSCKVLPAPDAPVRAAIRDMLRSRDFKPTGRAKPASEYLARAAAEGGLRTINPAVDACNAVSLHSGIPISVVDCDRLQGADALRIRLGLAGESYVFNPTGQVIELAGLVCLVDTQGPCANAIKDAQRTKTSDSTRSSLSILWSSRALAPQTAAALELYHALLRDLAEVEPVALVP
jgi:DNA/RNA-binding domain of Phe-tRNA-synthetase-like protein